VLATSEISVIFRNFIILAYYSVLIMFLICTLLFACTVSCQHLVEWRSGCSLHCLVLMRTTNHVLDSSVDWSLYINVKKKKKLFFTTYMAGIKVISTSSGFAAVQRETIKRKTLKILAKFGVAAPSPWGKHQNLNPRENHPGHSSNRNCKRLFRSCYGFPTNVPPVSPLTFCQNFVEKIPCPSP